MFQAELSDFSNLYTQVKKREGGFSHLTAYGDEGSRERRRVQPGVLSQKLRDGHQRSLERQKSLQRHLQKEINKLGIELLTKGKQAIQLHCGLQQSQSLQQIVKSRIKTYQKLNQRNSHSNSASRKDALNTSKNSFNDEKLHNFEYESEHSHIDQKSRATPAISQSVDQLYGR